MKEGPSSRNDPRRDPTHDSGYKLLYSHAPMVRDLLLGFVPGALVDAIDFSTLERCNGSYVTDDLRERAKDLVWRMRHRCLMCIGHSRPTFCSTNSN